MKKIHLIVFVFISCAEPKTDLSKQAAQEMIDADAAMSNMATQEGFFKALLSYAEDSVIFPREGKLPIMNKAEAQSAWGDRPIIKEITWKPMRAEAAKSGDMGYTFGFSTYKGADTTTYTNYCTIWRKQKDGSWKFVFDGGNNTPAPTSMTSIK
jgi:ketosteroid isomerase-like protein